MARELATFSSFVISEASVRFKNLILIHECGKTVPNYKL
jgi:hypothetical protein